MIFLAGGNYWFYSSAGHKCKSRDLGGGGGGGGMEMLNIMGLARLVNRCFKITVLEISGRPVVRFNFLKLYEHLSSVR